MVGVVGKEGLGTGQVRFIAVFAVLTFLAAVVAAICCLCFVISCFFFPFPLFVLGHFQCGTLQLRMLQLWRQRMHFIALKISVISADFTLVIQSALGSAQFQNEQFLTFLLFFIFIFIFSNSLNSSILFAHFKKKKLYVCEIFH